MIRYFLMLVLAVGSALVSAGAEAGVGLTTLPGQQGDGPVTLYYPTAAADQAVQRGPFTLQVAENAEPGRGNGRLVVLSHGSGGNPWVHAALARRLVEAGFTVAMPEHQGDNARDPSTPGPESWKRRPHEVSRAIDAVAATPRFASLLSLDKVGMYGMSAGGHTALSLAGGRWSPGNFKRHCEANIADDFHTCVGLATSLKGNFLDGVKKTVALGVIRQRFDDDTWQVHTDARIRAIVAGVPASADFDAASLANPQVPLGFVTAGQDKWLVPRFHSDRIVAACKTCEIVAHLPEGGHGFLLAPPPPRDRMSDIAADLLLDAPGFDRAQLPAIDRKIVSFFNKHL
jgi:predicted dienelactone hydrolase